jgi:hypothetical protein
LVNDFPGGNRSHGPAFLDRKIRPLIFLCRPSKKLFLPLNGFEITDGATGMKGPIRDLVAKAEWEEK